MEKRRTDFDLWAPAVTGTLFPVLSDCQGCAMSYVHTPGRGVVWRGRGGEYQKEKRMGCEDRHDIYTTIECVVAVGYRYDHWSQGTTHCDSELLHPREAQTRSTT